MTFDFDAAVDRRNSGSMKWDVGERELPMWVADMDFPTAPAVRRAIEARAAHGVFGYTDVSDAWYDAYCGWWRTRHGVTLEKDSLIFCTGVVPAISSMVRKLTTPAEKVVLLTPVYNIFYNSILIGFGSYRHFKFFGYHSGICSLLRKQRPCNHRHAAGNALKDGIPTAVT